MLSESGEEHFWILTSCVLTKYLLAWSVILLKCDGSCKLLKRIWTIPSSDPYSSPRLVVDRMDELIVELLFLEKVWCQKKSWLFMNLLCSGMVGFGLRRNLGTAEKEHPSPPSSLSDSRRGTGNVCTSVYHVGHYKWSRLLYKMWPNTFWIQIRSLQISKYITLDTLSLYEYWLVKPHLHLITIEVWIKSLLIVPSCADF